MEDGKRLTIIGRTGSGKTVAGLYHLALSSWTEKPWIIVDFKGDKHVRQIPGAVPMDISAPVPDDPGIYIVRHFPGMENELDDLMRRIWAKQNVGVYFDEGYMIGPYPRISQSYRALLTQGRSLGIDVITLTQRPKCLDLFCFTEASAIQLFDLSNVDDQKTVSRHISGVEMGQQIAPYHSQWYDVETKTVTSLGPVPSPPEILDIFERRRPKETFDAFGDSAADNRPKRIAL